MGTGRYACFDRRAAWLPAGESTGRLAAEPAAPELKREAGQ
jgi:hypothetical protein